MSVGLEKIFDPGAPWQKSGFPRPPRLPPPESYMQEYVENMKEYVGNIEM